MTPTKVLVLEHPWVLDGLRPFLTHIFAKLCLDVHLNFTSSRQEALRLVHSSDLAIVGQNPNCEDLEQQDFVVVGEANERMPIIALATFPEDFSPRRGFAFLEKTASLERFMSTIRALLQIPPPEERQCVLGFDFRQDIAA